MSDDTVNRIPAQPAPPLEAAPPLDEATHRTWGGHAALTPDGWPVVLDAVLDARSDPGPSPEAVEAICQAARLLYGVHQSLFQRLQLVRGGPGELSSLYVHAVHQAFCEATQVIPEDRLPTLLDDVACREDDLALEQDAQAAAGEVAHRLEAAEELLRTFPIHQGPAGISRVVVMVLDLLRDVRTATP